MIYEISAIPFRIKALPFSRQKFAGKSFMIAIIYILQDQQ